jgi:hypothetical protein
MLFELLGFLLSTNAKVKKMTIVSLMFEIVEMYIYYLKKGFRPSGIFFNSTGICLGKYPDNGRKAEKNKELVKKTNPFRNKKYCQYVRRDLIKSKISI